jgi:hypothetical protein
LPYRFLATIWKLKTEIWKLFLILFWSLNPDPWWLYKTPKQK